MKYLINEKNDKEKIVEVQLENFIIKYELVKIDKESSNFDISIKYKNIWLVDVEKTWDISEFNNNWNDFNLFIKDIWIMNVCFISCECCFTKKQLSLLEKLNLLINEK